MENPTICRTLAGEYCPVSKHPQNLVLTFSGSPREYQLVSYTCDREDCASFSSCPLAHESCP